MPRAPISEDVQARIREMRKTMSAEAVGLELGLNPKTVQKYSRGMNVGNPASYRNVRKTTEGKGRGSDANIVRPSVRRGFR